MKESTRGLQLQEIETRLHRPIPAVASDLALPPEISAKIQQGGGTSAYGQSADDSSAQVGLSIS